MPNKEECKKILEKNGEKYTKDEVDKIRKLLYELADIEFANYNLKSKSNEEEGNPIH